MHVGQVVPDEHGQARVLLQELPRHALLLFRRHVQTWQAPRDHRSVRADLRSACRRWVAFPNPAGAEPGAVPGQPIQVNRISFLRPLSAATRPPELILYDQPPVTESRVMVTGRRLETTSRCAFSLWPSGVEPAEPSGAAMGDMVGSSNTNVAKQSGGRVGLNARGCVHVHCRGGRPRVLGQSQPATVHRG